jgi:hypothetical protein
MGNELKVQNSLVVAGPASISGSLTTLGGLVASGSLGVTGSITSTNNIQGNQFSSTVGSVIGGRYFSDVLIAAGTVTYGSYGTSNVANFDIYANNENVGNGALLRLSSRFGGDNGAYLVSSLTGSVVLAVNGTGNSGLVLNGSTMNVGIGVSTPTGRLQVKGSGATSSTTALLVQNANASASFTVRDDGLVDIPGGGKLNFNNSSTQCWITTANGSTGLGSRSLNLPGTGGQAHWLFYNTAAFGIQLVDASGDNLTLTPGQNSGSFAMLSIGKSAASNRGGGGFAWRDNTNGNRGFTFGNPFNEFGDENGVNTRIVAGAGGTTGAGYNGGTLYLDAGATGGATKSVGNILISTNVTGSKVGIGVLIPSASLHISGSSNSVLLEIDSPAVNNILYVSGSGNVGIGTSNPSSALEVSGSITSKTSILSTGSFSHRGSFRLQGEPIAYGSLPYTGSWQDMIVFTPGANLGGGAYSYPQFYVTWGSSTTTITGGTLSTSSPASNVNALSLSAGGRNFSFYPYEQYISSAQNLNLLPGNSYGIGINTQSPTALLHISGASSRVLFEIDSPAVNNIIYVSGSGNVGIGTSTPAYTFVVKQPSNSTSTGFQITQTDSASDGMVLQFISSVAIIKNRTTGALTLGTNDTERFRITAGGDIGIGTTSPTAKLQVKGSGATSATTAFRVENTNLSGSLTVLDNGFVGIGKNTPISTLHLGNDTSGFLGDFTTPTITFNSLNNGIYLDSNRINFKAGGGFAFGCDSNGVIGNGFRINTALFNDLTTPIFVPVRTSPLGENSAGYGGNTAGNLSLITSGSSRLFISSSGNVGIGTITPSASLHVVGNTILSGSAGSGSALYAYKSGSTVLDIQGSQGQLFSVIDTLSGSLMSVNDISGLPILEVFSDDRVVMGTYGSPALIITGSNSVFSGSGKFAGALTVGSLTDAVSTENTLNVYPSPAGGTGEGGQILLAASGGLYTSASMLDNWQNQFRILKGTNAGGSSAGLMYVDLQSGNTNFVGAVTASAYSGLPNDYLYATRSGSSQTVGSAWANTDIIFNNTVVSKGISFNTSTGIASLTGGKVYRITARLAWGAAASYNLQFSCYTSGNTQIGPTTEIIQASNGTSNISDGTCEFIYAPSSNTDIKIRCTNNNTALSGEIVRADLNTQFIIQQIA